MPYKIYREYPGKQFRVRKKIILYGRVALKASLLVYVIFNDVFVKLKLFF